MSDGQKKKKDTSVGAESDLVLDLNFVPQWARRPPDAVRVARFNDAGEAPAGRGGRQRGGDDRRRQRPSRYDDDRPRTRPGSSSPSGRDGRDRTPERPIPPRPGGAERAARPGDTRREPPPPQDRRARPAERAYRPAPPPVSAPLDVRFLPERKPLADLIRKVSTTNRAYPLLDLAALLMAKEGCCFVKLEMRREAMGQGMYQCKRCKTLSLSREPLEAHVVEDHLDTLFDIQEEAVDPPTGTFVCVAKCGYSGELLGPPNHHSYAEAVRRLHADRFSNMDIEVYKRRIQTSHSQEDVERWKEEASKRIAYRLKAAGPETEAMDWTAAQRHMRQAVLPTAIEKVRRAVLSEQEAHAIRDTAIRSTLRHEWQAESRFPIHLAFALRAACRHRRLYVFKAGRGQNKGMNFVTAVVPTPLDPELAIPEIRDALLYIREHPGCTRAQMVEALRPGADPAFPEVQALLQPIHWLVEKGHIIEFFNGTLSAPLTPRKLPK